ncbi:MAG: TlpA family protein disulfide reductase [Steroidobacteraceae bacterium]
MTSNRRLLLLVFVGVAVLGSLAAVFLTRSAEQPSAAKIEAEIGQTIPEVLPDFTLATLEGPPRTLSSFDHPSLIVNFWATWCAPCRREIPLLRELRAERGARGVEVVGIAVDFREDVERYAAEIGLDYPLLIGEEDGLAAADAFGINPVFPFTVFADGQRRIVAVKIGELHADEAAYILDHIERINAGSLDLALAREQIRAEIRRLDALRPAAAKS